jgi:hypothetical protein
MSMCATDGAALRELVALAAPLCQEAERKYPRQGPGRKPEILDWMMTVLIVIAVAKQKKTKSSQYRFLVSIQHVLEQLGLNRFPSRSTYFERYHRAWMLFEKVIGMHSQLAVARGWVDARTVAADKSLVAARGPRWHQRQQAQGRRPCGVDVEATWGRSDYDGWVWGYCFEVVVSCGKNQAIWPLLASVDTGSCHESKSLRTKVPQLPRCTEYVTCDRAYDSDSLSASIEWTPESKRTGRHFVCPPIRRHNARKTARQDWPRTRQRRLRQQRRQQRLAFFHSPRGRRVYARRGCTVEPFNSWFKELFGLQDRVWHRGLANNRTTLFAAIFAYQLLLRINRRRGQKNGQVKWFIDQL